MYFLEAMRNIKMKKIVLILIIFNAFFPTVARSNDKTNNMQEQQLLLENKSNFLIGQNERSQQRAKYYFDQARNYVAQGKWELALENYNRAIQINPNLAEAYLDRGVVYAKQKKWELALAFDTQKPHICTRRVSVG